MRLSEQQRSELYSLLASKNFSLDQRVATIGKWFEQQFAWTPISELPPRRVPILMTGKSGYIAPNEKFVISGYYDPEYRPLSPWLDSQSTCLMDSGYQPTHWRLLTTEELP